MNIDSGVAIIGMAGRFPGANNTQELWNNLCAGIETIKHFAKEELDPGVNPAETADPAYVMARGLIQDAENFDAYFFGISPREAKIMDPQQRVFLETAWEALEDAGYDPDRYTGLIGVFGGAGYNTYFLNNILSNPDTYHSVGEHQVMFANAPDYLSTRVSYKLDLKGPSISLYTGCSSSLVAVSMAYDSLLSYQSDIALAGGVFVWCPQNSGYLYKEGEIFSRDGHCRPFDARANGTVFSNGVGLVVLKRLAEALEDRDHIYAVVRGTALNNDGAKKASFAAPSVGAQGEVISMAMANAGVDPDTISYIEAHGTGTIIGDPIEIEALMQAFGAKTSKKNFCAIGSIKGNVGHLDAAAGVTGLIKTVLALHHKRIPPSINFNQANPQIDFPNSCFYVNTDLKQWTQGNTPRRAGVTSLGVGGTNVHVVLEQAPLWEHGGDSRPMQLLLLSAKSEPALDNATKNLAKYLGDNPGANIADIAYTLQIGRRAFNHRRFVLCKDRDDAVHKLQTLARAHAMTHHMETKANEVAFMFPGQGAQYVNMGLNLYRQEAVFRQAVDQCAEILKSYLGLDLREIVFPEPSGVQAAENMLRQTNIQQPALFAIEYALAKLWEAWGIRPGAMIGHSIGEYVAACISGVFSLEDALMLVAHRGLMMYELPQGSMLAVSLPSQQLTPGLNDALSLAAVNASSLCVVSGPSEEIKLFQKTLQTEGVSSRPLHTSHAFHSKMMDPIVEPFKKKVASIRLNPPRIPYVSTATGTWVKAEEATDPKFWGAQLRNPVLFADGIRTLWEKPAQILLEVGPRNICTVLARKQAINANEKKAISSLADSAADNGESVAMLNALGQLWLAGISVDWKGFYAQEQRRRVPLPTYPFERRRCWLEIGRRHQANVSPQANMSEPQTPAGTPSSALPDSVQELPEVGSAGNRGVPPLNEVERKIAAIWQELLGVDQVRAQDDFFELGGDSLIAADLIIKIEKKFNQKIEPQILQEVKTVEQLGAYLSGSLPVQQSTDQEDNYSVSPGHVAGSKETIKELIEKNFNISAGKRFGWIYESSPYGPPVCLLLKSVKDDATVGMHAIFPRKFYVNGKPYLAGLGGDLAVDKSHRVLTPAIMLQKAVTAQCDEGGFDFFYGVPNKNSQAINKMMGQKMFAVARMTKPLRSFYYLKKQVNLPVVTKFLSKIVDLAARVLSKETYQKKNDRYACELVKNFDSRFDIFWDKAVKQFPIIGERSSAYLNWRYFQSPRHEHAAFALSNKSDGAVLGYIVFHTAENTAQIDDIIYLQQGDVVDALLLGFLSLQRKTGMNSVSIWLAGGHGIKKKLQKYGFFVRDEEGKLTLYTPFSSPLRSFLTDPENFYFMPGDNDI